MGYQNHIQIAKYLEEIDKSLAQLDKSEQALRAIYQTLRSQPPRRLTEVDTILDDLERSVRSSVSRDEAGRTGSENVQLESERLNRKEVGASAKGSDIGPADLKEPLDLQESVDDALSEEIHLETARPPPGNTEEEPAADLAEDAKEQPNSKQFSAAISALIDPPTEPPPPSERGMGFDETDQASTDEASNAGQTSRPHERSELDGTLSPYKASLRVPPPPNLHRATRELEKQGKADEVKLSEPEYTDLLSEPPLLEGSTTRPPPPDSPIRFAAEHYDNSGKHVGEEVQFNDEDFELIVEEDILVELSQSAEHALEAEPQTETTDGEHGGFFKKLFG
ncbi:MAG: hypothetical protein AAF355_13985 [Myxococcota bacterium]